MIANPSATSIDVLLERWAYWRLNGNGYPRQAAIANIGLSFDNGGFASRPPKNVEPSADVLLVGQAFELLQSMGGDHGKDLDCLHDKLLKRGTNEQLAAARNISLTAFKDHVKAGRRSLEAIIFWEGAKPDS